MAEDYVNILEKSWGELPTPKVLPDGSWRIRNRGASYQAPKGEDGSPQVLFVYQPQEPMDDVDTEALSALGEGYDPAMNRIFTRFYINDASDWKRVMDHIAKHGVVIDPASSIKDTLKAVRNKDVIGYLTSRTFTDNAGQEQTTNEAKTFAPIE